MLLFPVLFVGAMGETQQMELIGRTSWGKRYTNVIRIQKLISPSVILIIYRGTQAEHSWWIVAIKCIATCVALPHPIFDDIVAQVGAP